jgi:hypothetical protein
VFRLKSDRERIAPSDGWLKWRYASRHLRLLDHRLDPAFVRRLSRQYTATSRYTSRPCCGRRVDSCRGQPLQMVAAVI